MKNFIKKIFVIICVAIVIISTYSLNAYAGSLIMEKSQGKLIVNLPSKNQYFANLENMIPGQSFYEEMDIENKSIYPYELYLKISPKQGLNKKSLELLSYINMKIMYENKIIYNGCAHGKEIKNRDSGYLGKKISLGVFKPKDTKKLKVFFSVSKKLDSSFDNLESFTIWDFYSRRTYEGTNSKTDEYLNNLGGILNSIIPYTGDNANLYMYLLGITICIIIMMFLNKKKEKIKYEL